VGGIIFSRCLGRGLGGTPSMRVRMTKQQQTNFATLTTLWLPFNHYTSYTFATLSTLYYAKWLHKPTLSYTFLHIWYTFFLEFRLTVVHQFRYTFLHFSATHWLLLHFLHSLLHSLRLTTLSQHPLHFCTLWLHFLIHSLRFITLFYDQMLHFQYAIFVDSDLHPSLHLVHFRYTHYAWLGFTTDISLHLPTLWYISYTFGTLSGTKSDANGTLFS
jgi:hypothetical protein